MKISLIAALTRQHVIGLSNKTPWHLPADLKRFKQLTLGKPIIMGRKTYDSIGHILPDRPNIILSRSPQFKVASAAVASSLDDALAQCGSAEEVMIIGGAEVFEVSIDMADKLYLTWIESDIVGDTYFPAFDKSKWVECASSFHKPDSNNPLAYTFTDYVRRVM